MVFTDLKKRSECKYTVCSNRQPGCTDSMDDGLFALRAMM